jgi:hypothetical protein
MMMRQIHIASLLAALFLFACGGDSSSEQPGGDQDAGAGVSGAGGRGGGAGADASNNNGGAGGTSAGGTNAGGANAGGANAAGANAGGTNTSDGDAARADGPGVDGGHADATDADSSRADVGSADVTSEDAGAVLMLDIVAAKTHFLDYGKLRIGFAQAVDAATLQIALSPLSPAQLVVTGVSAVDATTVDATLGYYHLPRDYQLTVSGKLNDGTPFKAATQLAGLNNGARVAFLTKQTGTGDIKSWPSAPASANTPVEAADGVCKAEAEAAGFHGTFAAFLSAYGSYDAGCRTFGLLGTFANNCGQSSMPADHAPWLSTSGLPIVEGASGVVANAWETPIPTYADGSLPGNNLLWTGTSSGAVSSGSGDDCGGWSQTTGFATMDIFSSQYLLAYDGADNCGTSKGLLCFQVGGSFFGPSTLHLVSGRRAFVSKGKLTGAMSFNGANGVAAGDELCRSEAAAAGYANASAFHAYLGTTSDDAICHILGRTGKVAANCGLAALPSDNPWRRADDFPLATAAQLVSNKLVSPLSVAPDLSTPVTERPWTGTKSNGSTDLNCGDWSVGDGGAATAEVGTPRSITSGWAFYSTSGCSASAPVYCFEN